MNLSEFTGYILAGGKSSRMGKDKAFLKTGERTFLENAVEVLKPNCGQVKIVLNKSQTDFIARLPPEIPYIFDIYEDRGALGGIHAALNDCETEFAIILAVDLPFVTSDAVKTLARFALESEEFSVFVPKQLDGRLQPLCAVYRAGNCLKKIEEILLKENSYAILGFLETVKFRIIETADLKASENLFANVNSPEDFYKIGKQ